MSIYGVSSTGNEDSGSTRRTRRKRRRRTTIDYTAEQQYIQQLSSLINFSKSSAIENALVSYIDNASAPKPIYSDGSALNIGSYNTERANKLYEASYSLYGNDHVANGYCATGVSQAINKAFGYRTRGNGNDYGNVLSSRSDWIEITDKIKSVDDLAKLPAGAVVSWSKSGADYASQKYGHVYISDGKGGELSDFHSASVINSNRKRAKYGTFRVFVPA